ncbi:MAG: heat shock protein HtpX [Firmicutes bacterium ADurb.Bin193]|nr:MAG: heat shock protein HtpX [Firmicutes bacterium ADurb.Bin193]
MDIKEINALRHPGERILYVACAFLNTMVITLLILGLSFMWQDLILNPYVQNVYVAVATAFGVAFFSMGSTFAQTKVYSVRVGENQFPELYAVVKKFAESLGMKKIPAIYVKQENGLLNAFAAYFWGRNYVLLNTEIFEIAYLEHKDINAVSFIMAHEMAHICLHHTRFWYNASILIAKFIPVLGTSLSRAQEYSCDRIALKLCPEGKQGIFMLLLGRHLYKNVNIDEYLAQAERTRGWFEFFVNINSSHPVNTRRVLAIYKPEKRGRLLF